MNLNCKAHGLVAPLQSTVARYILRVVAAQLFLTRILGSYQIMRIPREACGHTSKNRRDAYLLTYLPTYLPCLTLPHLALTYFTYQDARIPVSSYPIILQILRIPREACGHTSKTERDAYLLTYLFTLPYLALLYFTLLYFTYLR